MAEKYTYLLVDLGCLLVPFIASFHPRTDFYRQWRFFLLPCIAVAAFFLAWDSLFTNLGVWGFNPRYVTGLYLFNLPVEEVLFFIAIPYACVFTYFCVGKFIDVAEGTKLVNILSAGLIGVSSVLAIIYCQRYYTATTFALLATVLLRLHIRRSAFRARFFLSFAIILLPFAISNGILTGSFTEEPVVIYNNAHNLGIRLGTIPVEDLFYAMLMLVMNVAGFEYMKSRQAHRQIKAMPL
jgi:lycopene cyclase domain-containing protein